MSGCVATVTLLAEIRGMKAGAIGLGELELSIKGKDLQIVAIRSSIPPIKDSASNDKANQLQTVVDQLLAEKSSLIEKLLRPSSVGLPRNDASVLVCFSKGMDGCSVCLFQFEQPMQDDHVERPQHSHQA